MSLAVLPTLCCLLVAAVQLICCVRSQPYPPQEPGAQKVAKYEWASFIPAAVNSAPNATETLTVADKIHYYRGHVAELPQSRAHGVLRKNGLFEGVVEAGSETYFIESPVRFFGNTSRIKSSKEQSNRAIIYRWEDLRLFPVETACKANDPSCYYYQTVLHYKALFPPTDGPPIVRHANLYPAYDDPPPPVGEDKTCHIHVIADHRFFANVGFASVQKTVEAIVWHIEEADHLYRSTEWTMPSAPRKVGVSLKRITVFTSLQSPGNPFQEDDLNDEQFLKKMKFIDTGDACIAMTFTFSYLQGTFGISYVGTVCNPRYNWALVNFRSMDGEVRQRAASVITVMHEIAHVFGANHDAVDTSPTNCVPAGKANDGHNGGNYIMYPTSAMGMHNNNRRFSPCSIYSIGTNLQNRLKTNCMNVAKEKYELL
ncbi:disintegrin and metalloproteinase domain-containing protein 10-like [Paramacrobiotus metropolitanus]|uniref:disintegrin and metalloproteinase domain-containing protein 10-like n=1 Tax=Paramacrobiotus metropolitanus TaxID=2943436 RepID=UPI0024455EFF|nr:disintegrin and metalloproteinase domain-containing protein 10-like [Paramacrobiotus metropolitanus]